MDWANEEYVKVYRRETDDDLVLSWQARALWKEMLIKFDRSGLIETKRGARGLAAVVRWPVDVVELSLPELIEDGRVRPVPAGFFAPNFLEAQEASKSDRARQKESRQRRASTADRAVSPQIRHTESAPRDQPSHGTEPRDETSQVVTLSSALLSSADPLLREPLPPAPPAEPPANSFDREAVKSRAIGHLAEATWRRLSDLRTDHASKLRLEGIQPFPRITPGTDVAAFRELRQRIREEGDRAREVCDHVIRVLDEQATSTKSIEWLSEKSFLEKPWRKSRETPLKPKRRAAEPRAPIEVVGERAGAEDLAEAWKSLGISKGTA